MDNKLLITICTATYNRGPLLNVLYKSLTRQTLFNFEWLIIDDGSTDKTGQLVTGYQLEAPFQVRYYKQNNQGKHVAINKGVPRAKGDYFFIVDSDDRLPPHTIAIITEKVKNIHTEKEIAGIVGLKCFFNKQVVGSAPLFQDIICDIFEYRYLHKVKGDRAEVFKTEILKKYPFPVFESEKFIPESIVWNRLGLSYQMLFFQENIYECEYLPDGLSTHSISLRRNYPIGAVHLYAELAAIEKIGLLNRYKAYVNFWRFFFCISGHKDKSLGLIKDLRIAVLCMPLGFLFYLKDTLFEK